MAENEALHGVNLTGWLKLEPWVRPELFEGTGSLAEDSLINVLGSELYSDLINEHRDTFITADDFKNIASRGLNAVRIPIPWYVLGEKGPNPGRFVGCLSHVDSALDWAHANDIKVVLALAVNPGAPGEEDVLNSTPGGMRDGLLRVLSVLASRYRDNPALHGIEVADEPVVERRVWFSVIPGVPPHVLRNYYRDAYSVIRGAGGSDITVILPDAGMHGSWRGFMGRGDRYDNVWLDSHLFHHSEGIDATGPSGSRELVERSRKALHEAERSGLPVMVGAWSGALPFADSVMTPEGRIALERVYVADQLTVFGDRPWFFQTWKTSGHLSGWDSRLTLSSFERGML